MRIGYNNIRIELSVKETANSIKNKLGNLINNIKKNIKQKFTICFYLEENNFVYQTGEIKIKEKEIKNLFLNIQEKIQSKISYSKPMIEEFIDEKYIISISPENTWEDYDYKDFDIKIGW